MSVVKVQCSRGDSGACSPEKILENLDCLRPHFARFYSGESEEEKKRVVQRRSKSPPLDLLKIQHTAHTCPMAGQVKFSSNIPRFGRSNI